MSASPLSTSDTFSLSDKKNGVYLEIYKKKVNLVVDKD